MLNNNVANNHNSNMNTNPGLGSIPVMQGGRNGHLLQGILIADHNDAVKLFLEENAVLEDQNIQGSYVLQRNSGQPALYTLPNQLYRLELRILKRDPTQSELGEHKCFFRKIISPTEDIAY